MSIFRLCLLMLLLSGSILAIAQNELKIQPLKMSNEQLKIIAQGMNVSREQLLLDSKTIDHPGQGIRDKAWLAVRAIIRADDDFPILL